jgi:zinc protease
MTTVYALGRIGRGAAATLVAAAIVLSSGGGVGGAQAGQAPKQASPQAAAAAPASASSSPRLPVPVRKTLPNGLQIIVVEDHRQPIAYVQLEPSVSTMDDPVGGAGTAEAMAAMWRAGTTTRTAEALKTEWTADLSVMEFEAEYSARSLRMFRRGPARSLDAALDIFADMLQRSTYPEAAIAAWKSGKLTQIARERSSSAVLADERLRRTLYGDDARGNILASAEGVERLTRERVVEFARKHLTPDETIVGVIGDVQPDAVIRSIEQRFGGWKGPKRTTQTFPPPPPSNGRRVRIVHRPGADTSYIKVGGVPGVNKSHPAYVPAQVLNDFVIQHFRTVQNELGAPTKLERSKFYSYQHIKHFGLAMSTPTERTEPVLARVLDEFRSLREKPRTEAEIKSAGEITIATYVGRLPMPNFVLHTVFDATRIPPGFWDAYVDRVRAVTPADVRKAAAEFLQDANAVIVVAGDADRIAPALARYGPVEIFDTNGQPLRRSAPSAAVLRPAPVQSGR